MKDKTIKRVALGGILAAATILLTTLVSIPIPGGLGFVNLGDAGVLTAAFLLGGPWGALCGGAASALSDLLLGYGAYAPATFLIKGGMALVFGLLYRALPNRVRVAAFFIASLLVPAGYFLYETILYGAVAAAPNLLFNLVQGLIGAGIAIAVCKISEKTGLRGKQP